MLEEAFGATDFPPGEAALALLQFVRYELPAGGAAAEARFFHLFRLLCERLFGPIQLTDPFDHEFGGWLSRASRWDRPGQSSQRSGGGSSVYNRSPIGGGSSSSNNSGGGGGSRSSTFSSDSNRSHRGNGISQLGSSYTNNHNALSSYDGDPVVQLLAGIVQAGGNINNSTTSAPNQESHEHHQHLQGLPTLIEAISEETEHRPGVGFKFPFPALPVSTQNAMMSLLKTTRGGNHQPHGGGAAEVVGHSPKQGQQGTNNDTLVRDNASRLLGQMLRVRPTHQTELRLYQQKMANRPLSFSPGGQHQHRHVSSSSMLSPTSFPTSSPTKTRTSLSSLASPSSQLSSNNSPPTVMLSMLEYYLFAYIRYPLALPSSSTSTSSSPNKQLLTAPQGSPTHSSGVPTPPTSRQQHHQQPLQIRRTGTVGFDNTNRYRRQHYGDAIYSHLFRGYLKKFLPHSTPNQPFLTFSNLTRESELFLRVIIEFWLDGECILPVTRKAAAILQERRKRTGFQATNHNSSDNDDGNNSAGSVALDLDTSYDMIQSKGYQPLPSMVQSCIRNVVNHLVSDPVIALAVTDAHEATKSRGVDSSQPLASGDTSLVTEEHENEHGHEQRGDDETWCLSPSMTIFQQSFYNYVRTTFRHAPIHVTDSPFYTAMNAWLVWIEPWNVVLKTKKKSGSNFTPSKAKTLLNSVSSGARGQSQKMSSNYDSIVTIPKAASKSRFSKKWESYIAANLHLYTVPLAIYLRRARELDFSSREFQHSMKYLQRVFRVYSPAVINTINRLLSSDSTSTRTSSHHNSLVRQHEQCLGEFSPALFGTLRLASCEKDMRNLLEEIYMQHSKTMRELDFFDRIAARLESLVGQGPSSDETTLKALVEQAKVIVNLPPSYEVIPNGQKYGTSMSKSMNNSAENSDDGMKPDRLGNGLLSEQGKQQLIAGTVKMNPMDIAFVGDNTTSRTKSHELSFLVSWTNLLSNWINIKLGLTRNNNDDSREWLRINLRFLADYRNVLFICLVGWTWQKIRA